MRIWSQNPKYLVRLILCCLPAILSTSANAQSNGRIGLNVAGYGSYANNLTSSNSQFAPSLSGELVFRWQAKAMGELGIFVDDMFGLSNASNSIFYGVVMNLVFGQNSGFSFGIKFDPVWAVIIGIGALSPSAVTSGMRTYPLGIGFNIGYKFGNIWPRIGLRAFNSPAPIYFNSNNPAILAIDTGVAISF